jgi:predicted amidohydrolase
MRVGLAQIECVDGDPDGNLAVMADFVTKASEQGCGAVWFPELSDTGYALSQVAAKARAWPGPAHDRLSELARQHQIIVGAGLSERVGLRVYNSLAVFDRQGRRVAGYRKTHLFAAGEVNEAACFSPGPATGDDPAQTVVLDGLTHGLSICYDLRFPELYRRLADRGASVLVNVTAWPAARTQHWDVLTRARALENQAYFLGVGRVGEDEGVRFAGRSRLIDPTGKIVAEASTDSPELLIAEIDPKQTEAFRSQVPALEARRPGLWT